MGEVVCHEGYYVKDVKGDVYRAKGKPPSDYNPEDPL